MRGHPTTLSPPWQDKKIDTYCLSRHNACMLRNKWVRRLLCVIICLFGLLLLAAGGLAFYLYGTPLTRLGDGDFHPSWSAEERVALQKAEQYLLHENRQNKREMLTSVFPLFNGKELSHFSLDWLEVEMTLRSDCSKWRNLLYMAAVSGNADQRNDNEEEEWNTLVIEMAYCGAPEIIKAMVRHGAMLNLEGDLENSDDLKYINSSLLMHVLKSGKYKKEELCELADWLVMQPGEGLHRAPGMMLTICSLPHAADAMEWALERGFVKTEFFYTSEGSPVNPGAQIYNHKSIFFRLLDEGIIDLNESRGTATVLQVAAMEYPLKSTEAVRKLLQAGAEPNLIPAAAATKQLKQTPLQIVLKDLSLQDDQTLEQHTRKQLELAELLIQHGAISPEYPLPWTPPAEEEADKVTFRRWLHGQMEALYRRHGIEPTQR